MRFKGTLALLAVCAAVGAFIYFYEIKGGEQREKAKQEENRLWKVESGTIQQIDLITPELRLAAVRTGEKDWKLTSPRELEADGEELNRIASSAAEINRESVLEANAADLSRFGLNPAQVSLQFRTKDGKEYKVRFGNNNPTGSSTYGALEGKNEVFLVASYTAGNFKKKLDDLRNRAVLRFDQYEANSLELTTAKERISLVKEGDKWFIQGRERWAADSSAVSGLLSSLSSGKLKEFFDDKAEDYATLGFEKPLAEARVTVGKDKAIRRLVVGSEKAELRKKGAPPVPAPKKKEGAESAAPATDKIYIARDESRGELFFVEKDLVDKLLKPVADYRDKALASFPRWDVDGISLTNSKGTFSFAKGEGGGDWVIGDAKKKAKWDAVNGILDAMEKQVKEFIDAPAALSTYGLDKPVARVVLKQGGTVKAECMFGKAAKDGVYAQVRGESSVKVADKESLEKLDKAEADFLEPPPPAPAEPAAKK